MKSRNRYPYQVICSEYCRLQNRCDKICIATKKYRKYLEGCNYSREGDCKYCSYKNKCILIKPYSKELGEVESKRILLENENNTLKKYVYEWNDIESNLNEYGVNSVNEVVYFPENINNKQKMLDKIKSNQRLIKAYFKKEKELIENM